MDLRRYSRKSMFHALEPFKARRKSDRSLGVFLTLLISLNLLAVILETVESIYTDYEPYFIFFEVFSVSVFSLEYLLRVWVSAEDYKKSKWPRLKFIFSPMAIIDLMAVIPFFLPLFFHVDLRSLRALRLFRIVRVFKLGRYSRSLRLLGKVLNDRTPDLVVTTSAGMILVSISASIMYFFEHEAQPEVFSSIPAAMWWAVSTLTTVGYGDVYPITIGGKIFGSFVALLGIGLIAAPAGILGAGLMEEFDSRRRPKEKCPHCGKNPKVSVNKPAA